MSAPPRSASVPRVDPVALARTRRRLLQAGQAPWLHAEVARRMAERLPLVRLQPQRVVDWSGPLGASGPLLHAAYPSAKLCALRVDDGPAATPARPRWWPFAGGARAVEALPAADIEPGSCQLLWANMSLQAHADIPALFAQWHRTLAVGGFLMFSTLGPGTLAELRAVHAAHGWGEPMAPLVDMHDLGDALVQAGFADPVMDQETVTLNWPDGDALLRELRGLGANVSPLRHPGCRTPRWRSRWLAALAGVAGAGRPSLSFELVYGHAFKVAARTRVDTEATVSLEAMRAQLRGSGRAAS